MKSRDEGLKSNWGTICTLVPLVSDDGKKHKEMTAIAEGIFCIIQSIPSPKAEPFKQWMAHVASIRLDQMNPQTWGENMQCAVDGGDVACVVKEQLEQKIGGEVVSPLSAKKAVAQWLERIELKRAK